MEQSKLRQGDIIYVSFDPAIGHEQQKRRPGIVISNDYYDSKTWMKKVVPVTSTVSGFPLHFLLPKHLSVHGEVMLEQERCLDLSKRDFDFIGQLPSKTLDELLELVHETY